MARAKAASAAKRLEVYDRPKPARIQSGTRSVPDSTSTFVPAAAWLGGQNADPERRAEALIDANRGLLRDLNVGAQVVHRRGEAGLLLETESRIGAIPLVSPITGRPDFGLTVQPRFPWAGAGDMLAGTGFRVVPELLPLPDLPQSERRIPPWVLSSVVLTRMRALLDALQRRFVFTDADLPAPRGAVDWATWSTSRLPAGRALEVPCRFPDLRDDEHLRAAIHWVVLRHRDALQGQASAGIVVRVLLDLCATLLTRLAGSRARLPSLGARNAWSHSPLAPRVFRDGLSAIDWTVEERGFGGLSDLSGVAWRMDMEVFFEAWVEAVAAVAARRSGATLRVGRTEQTRVALRWQPPSAGSQRSLLPDIVLARSDVVVVVDAKYKRHADQIERAGWSAVGDDLREQHRADVLQALAYSTLFDAPRVVACLAYPARPGTAGGQGTARRAVVRSGSRRVELALLGVPLSGRPDVAAHALEGVLASALG